MIAELLAPAGSYEALRAAFLAGADAVYLGGERFGARAYAVNFNKEALLGAIDEAHLFNKKLYLTVNTLIKDDELEDLYDFLLPYYKAGLDAVIVQDTGAMKRIRECFPGLHIHASTQMTVTGYHGAKLLQEQGVCRVIPARELSAEEIRKIRETTDLEIECFVHGALCYCYSGQCLMSSFMGGRSGNRGRCAQPCRLPYDVYQNGRKISDRNSSYPLNTKDICTVELLPKILKAGVDSLKIEGRMKRPEYTAGVVSVYRKYLDLLAEDPDRFSTEQEDLDLLWNLFNRDGFSRSYYYTKNGPEMMALKNEKASGDIQRKADDAYRKIQEEILSKEPKITLKAEAEVCAGKARLVLAEGCTIDSAESTEVYDAKNRALSAEDLEKQLSRTGGTPYRFEFEKTAVDDGLFMPVSAQNELRRAALAAFKNQKLSHFRRECETMEKDAEIYNSGKICDNKLSIAVMPSELGQLLAAEELPQIDRVYIPAGLFAEKEWQEEARKLQRLGKEVSIALTVPSRNADRPEYSGLIRMAAELDFSFLSGSVEDTALLLEWGLEDRIRLDSGVYTMNSESMEFWHGQGIVRDTVPLELSRKELKRRDNRFSEMIVYGRIPLMVSAQCVMKNYGRCSRDNAKLVLRDRRNYRFPVYCDCFACRNIIYNSVPLSLISRKEEVKELQPGGVRFVFTDEPAEQVRSLLNSWIQEEPYREDFEFTRGHFNRGVE
ncbi:MAG: U32 family peptidase [Lachnospiraceae bacterium]|nr:U32 family peptidase [Lachnospiraceae bacterium]